MFDTLFTWLFTYRPVVFEQGEFRFDPSLGSYVAGVIGLGIVAAAVLTSRRTGGRVRTRDRVVLLALRGAILGLLLLCLFRPVLVVKAAVPQQNVLGVLVDDSRSMQVADWQNKPRGEFVREQFGSLDRPLMKGLSEKFLVREFHFSSTASRREGEGGLTFTGTQTRIGAALDAARQELAGLPVAGLVLVSDGADTSDVALTEALLGLKAEKLPVYTVGVGEATLSKDVQIDRVTSPPSVLMGSSLLLDVTLTHTGYAGQQVSVDVEDEGRIIGSERVTLPPDGTPATARVRVIASEPGPRVFRFRVSAQPGEVVAQNNEREATINVREARDRILYYEGEPRFEMKFIRRAVEDDKNLQLVSILRTADNKYYRQGVESGEELIAGFPKTREELFKYRALMLGSVEAGAFTGDQLAMIAEYVDKRGGGLLVIGGARSFSEGGYQGTTVAEVLPVVIDRPATQTPTLLRLKVSPTRVGTDHAATQIAATPAASASRWAELPQVTSVNPLTAVKPGASILLSGADERGRPQVVLASQRYGRGKALAFTLQDSWLWQMHASMSLEDQTHENFWRQLMRWLVDGVPGQVEVRSTTEHLEPGEPVVVEATVVDPAFVELNDARVTAAVTQPDGTIVDVPLQWTGERQGQYRATFPSRMAGRYQVKVDAERGGEAVGSGTSFVSAGASNAEYFDPTMHAQTLKRIAEETGGRFYTSANAQGLAEDVRYGGRGVTTVEERDLWHMPIVLVLMLGLACAEWGYRRAVGLA